MRKEKFNSLIFLIVMLLSPILLFASGGQESVETEKAETVKIAYWNNNIDTFLEKFKQDMPGIDLEFQFIDNSNYDNIITTQLVAGTGPDIICVGGNFDSFAAAGFLADLSNEDFTKKYLSPGLERYTYKEKIYALPGLSWFDGLYYNKKIFRENGLSVPQTWNEFLEICEILDSKGVKPLTAGLQSWDGFMKYAFAMMNNEFYSTEESRGFNSAFNSGEKTLAGTFNDIFKTTMKVVDQGYITDVDLSRSYDQALDEFALEKAAMWESGPWAESAILEKNPEIELGFFGFKGSKPGPGWLIGGPGQGFALNVDSEKKEAVKKVLDYISTPEAQEAFFADNTGASYLKGVEFTFSPIYDDVKGVFALGQVNAAWNNWDGATAIIQEIGKGLQEYVLGKKTIEQVLEMADKKAIEIRAVREN